VGMPLPEDTGILSISHSVFRGENSRLYKSQDPARKFVPSRAIRIAKRKRGGYNILRLTRERT